MKKFVTYATYALLVSSMVLTSCSKDEDEDGDDNTETPTETPSTTVSPNYEYPNSSGALVAVNAVTEQTIPFVGTTEIETITAVATFLDGTGSLQDAGTVTFSGKTLTQNANNSYVLINGLGLDGNSQQSWTVGGSSTVDAFNYTNNDAYPKVTGWSGVAKSITKGSEFTVNWGGNSGFPDSVLVVISSGATLMKTVSGNTTSVTFTADETNTLTASSNALIQVTPYSINAQTIYPSTAGAKTGAKLEAVIEEKTGGKTYYFINQTTYSNLFGSVQ